MDNIVATFGERAVVVTLTTKTTPKMLKKGRTTGSPCPYRGVHRIARRNGIIGCSYESCVNRQRVREGQPTDENDVILYFDALSLWGGKGEHEGRFIVRHRDTGKRYIAFRPTQRVDGSPVLDDEWKDEEGNLLNPAELEEWLPLSSHNRRQVVDREVLWRTIALDNILSISYKGEEIPLAA
jgi:hypothetical protein